MSTRAQIVVQGKWGKDQHGLYPVYIYKHSDGYPEGVLPMLEPLVKTFLKDRGFEPDYLVAQIVRRFAVGEFLNYQHGELKHAMESEGNYPDFMSARGTLHRMTGWGLDNAFHGDIEYIYYIRSDGVIEVRECEFGDERDLSHSKLMQEIDCNPSKEEAA